ncbi:MAG: hypothetical protein WEE50_00240 [Chloroflexota bacterium]
MKSVTRKSASEAAAPSVARSVRDRLGLDRLRFPSELVVLVAFGIVVAGQFAEDLVDSPPLQMLPPEFSSRRWTLIAVVLYSLLILRLVDRTVRRSLPSFERVLRLEPAAFRAYVHRLRPPDPTTSLVLLAISALIVTVLFAGLGQDLPLTNDPVTGQPLYLPPDPVAAIAILAGYTVVGWAGLSLIYLVVSLGRALGQLCREPLEVDVFDTTKLLPFGNIALASALAPVGIIGIFLFGLGPPTNWLSWSVLLLAGCASVVALLYPLRGIHRQMSDAKEAVLADLNARIANVYRDVSRKELDAGAIAGLNARTNTLVPLRRTVHEMTTWPFADTVAFGRAVLIASAPLIYTVLSELIKVFWINPLSA